MRRTIFFDPDTGIQLEADDGDGKPGPVLIITTSTPRGEAPWLTHGEALALYAGLERWKDSERSRRR
jgi:hypothetical protein